MVWGSELASSVWNGGASVVGGLYNGAASAVNNTTWAAGRATNVATLGAWDWARGNNIIAKDTAATTEKKKKTTADTKATVSSGPRTDVSAGKATPAVTETISDLDTKKKPQQYYYGIADPRAWLGDGTYTVAPPSEQTAPSGFASYLTAPFTGAASVVRTGLSSVVPGAVQKGYKYVVGGLPVAEYTQTEWQKTYETSNADLTDQGTLAEDLKQAAENKRQTVRTVQSTDPEATTVRSTQLTEHDLRNVKSILRALLDQDSEPRKLGGHPGPKKLAALKPLSVAT